MSLTHILVTKLRGYDMCTLYFDDRSEKDTGETDPFLYFEKEFVSNKGYFQSHPEDTFGQTYFGYFLFPHFSAEEIYVLYKAKCESQPALPKRYNIYFTKEYTNLEEMIRKFDRPIDTLMIEKHRLRTYSHRLEYFERSIQILRDMQTAVYETESNIAPIVLEYHNRFLEKK
ncbi:MAG: hypothetical protein JW969_12425 [Spirochaetales bacterium]|nr:hypothetical protein [Spirochaetales bacterium]